MSQLVLKFSASWLATAKPCPSSHSVPCMYSIWNRTALATSHRPTLLNAQTIRKPRTVTTTRIATRVATSARSFGNLA